MKWAGSVVLVALAAGCLVLRAQEPRPRESRWANWLEEDVVYIITPEERQAFAQLNTDEERENFLWLFWFRRDPTPDNYRNEFKVEHYRRLRYANEHFGGTKPGRSDRGQLYIRWGPPDEVESHPEGKNGSEPFELWRYAYLEGVGEWPTFRFTDRMRNGEYRFDGEAQGMERPWGEESRKKWVAQPREPGLRLHIGPIMPPRAQFKDLEELLSVRISTNGPPFGVKTSMERVTEAAFLVEVTVAVEGVEEPDAEVQVFGRVAEPSGRIVEAIEGRSPLGGEYGETIVLPPGAYKLEVAVKDIRSGKVSLQEAPLVVSR